MGLTNLDYNRDCNQDETTALKNRIKLLELENQLLKCDVSNKQKFTDTILEHNSRLSHNIDVTPASPTTYDHHVKSEPQDIKENQNGERSDTEHNGRRKHDYKSNRENKKNNDNNKEKEKSKQDNLPTDTNKKNVYILGDSIVKYVE